MYRIERRTKIVSIVEKHALIKLIAVWTNIKKKLNYANQ